jgi:hypothetical protein
MISVRRIRPAAVFTAAFVVVGSSLVPTSPARAQSLWLDRSEPRIVQLEILKPDPSDADDLSFGSSVWYLSGRKAFSPKLHGVIEVPWATASLGTSSAEDGLILGNPYVGIEFGSATSAALGEFGARLPFAGSKPVPQALGVFSDLERWPAWVDDAAALRAGVRLRTKPTDGGATLEARIAPELWFENAFEEVDVWMIFGACLRFDWETARAGMAFTGRTFFAEATDVGSTSTQFDVAADFGEGQIRPGVSLRLPLDETIGNQMNLTYGLSVTYVPR